MATADFKPEIEGLRALAILPILVFHLEPRLCPGGFAGVDIFFVISGFLITRMILTQGSGFKGWDFYKRRIYRLFPALLVTLAASLFAGWKLLGPIEYELQARSALAAAFGLSNVHFLAAVDYFNADSLSHSLLHTWSLGVEEQFYLVWPWLLLLALRVRVPIWVCCLGIAMASLALVAFLQPIYPKAAFYLMPFRMFEFAVGAALTTLEAPARAVSTAAKTVGGLVGFALLAGVFFWCNGQTRWPGPWSVLAVVATAALMLSAGAGPWKAVFAHAAPRFIGRISYSLYLVHWPIITLYRSWRVTDPSPTELVGLGGLSILAGALLFWAVEEPFRLKRGAEAPQRSEPDVQTPMALVLATRWRGTFLASATVAYTAAALAIVHHHGVPSRIKMFAARSPGQELSFGGDMCAHQRNRCLFGDKTASQTVYLIGDSHALNLVHGLDILFRQNKLKGIAFFKHGCLFAYDTTSFQGGIADPACRDTVRDSYEFLAGTREPVIFAGDYFNSRGGIGARTARGPRLETEPEYYAWIHERFMEGFEKINARSRTIVMFKQTYSTLIDLPKCVAREAVASGGQPQPSKCKPTSLNDSQRAYHAADVMIDGLARQFPSMTIIDPKLLFCDAASCATQSATGAWYFRDSAHLTTEGSEFLVGNAANDLMRALTRPN